MIYVEQGPHGFIDPMFSETILALPVEVDKQCNWGWKIGDRQHRQKAEAGQMLVVPADIESQWDVDGGRKILVLAVPNETVRNVLGPSCPQRIGDAFWKLTEHTWADPFIEVMMNRLWESTAGNEAADSYLTDGLFLSILSQLLIRAGTSLQLNSNVALPQWRFKRVQQFVDSRLGDEINIDELASAAGLSRRHFSRSFAQETGETPHRWLMQQRLEKAKEMLSTTDFALCEIAEICGFSSQSHLTTTLKQATGMTPRNWRQHHRG
ncbi:helix-turn-helix transcriptional regulator [Paraburkholderia aspalathi]|nr:helix-turn-helix transcriptional regulator [Paraburkholderia aspalathi]